MRTVYVPDLWRVRMRPFLPLAATWAAPQSGGQYVPGSGTLLLARVTFTDSTGGRPGYVKPHCLPGPGPFQPAQPVPLRQRRRHRRIQWWTPTDSARKAPVPAFHRDSQRDAPATAQETGPFAPVSTGRCGIRHRRQCPDSCQRLPRPIAALWAIGPSRL